MASSKKRTATRELNHENWNDDEEKEERGVFEQARSDVLQSRVIKKAKRRGVSSSASESGSSGTFTGFSGFKSTSLSSSESKPSFDFLKSDSKGFGLNSNGNGNGNDEKKGDERDQEKKSIPLSEMFKAKPGSWKCSVCDISNESTADKCVACTSPKPGETTSKPPSKWTCDTCMVPNAPEANECVCCQAKKPGSDSKSVAKTSGFSFGKVSKTSEGSSFKFGTSNNNGNNCKLDSSSSGFTFGASSTTKESTTPGSGFKFGTPSTTATESTSSGTGFKFGSAEKGNSSEVSPASGFKFGNSSTGKDTSTGFLFGSYTSTTSTVSSGSVGFKFTSTTVSSLSGTPKSSPSSTSFSFKSAPFVANKGSTNFKFEPSTTSTTSSNSDVKLSSSVAGDLKGTNILAKEENSSISKSDSRDKYAANLRALNRQLAKWVKSKVDENPNVILSPIFSDYENHLKDIAEKYPLTSSSSKVSSLNESKNEQAPLLGAVFGSKENKCEKVSFSTGSSGNTGFGSFSKSSEDASSPKAIKNISTPEVNKDKDDQIKDKEDTPRSEGTSLFSFGSTAITSSGFSFGSTTCNTTSGFSFGTNSTPVFEGGKWSSFFSGASATASTSVKNDESTDNATEDEPPKVEVKTVEESDAKFSMRCKLYYKKEKDFVDRGLGMVHIKLLDDNKKVQFLVRAETNLGNVLLNIMLNDKITFTQRGNNLQFVAVPNPPIKGIPDGPVSMLIKVKNASMAEELYIKIQEILKEASSSS